MRNWRSRQPFFVKCCENGTEFEAFGSRSLCGPKDPISVRTYFRVPTGRPGQSSPYTRDSCRQRSLTSFALLLRRGQSTKSRNRPGPHGGSDDRAILGDGPTLPTIVFHGDRDITVYPNNGDHILEQSMRTMRTQKKVHRGRVPGGHAFTRTNHTD